MNKLKFFLIAAVAGCSSPRAVVNSHSQDSLVPGGKLFTALFIQQAAEYKALSFQAYNIARLRLDESLADQSIKKPRAIITDIDETILDNTPYAVHQALMGKDYEPSSWISDWTSRAEADTLAGAPAFFKYAASKNVEVFYITNREEQERAATLKNLQKFNLPFADDAHLLMKQGSSGKEDRRLQVASGHEIVLLLGDNLSDFSNIFDKKSAAERTSGVQANAGKFGSKFIVLPNPNYGDWESALYQYNYRLTPAQKDSVIKKILKTY